jgi:hypothetical protein
MQSLLGHHAYAVRIGPSCARMLPAPCVHERAHEHHQRRGPRLPLAEPYQGDGGTSVGAPPSIAQMQRSARQQLSGIIDQQASDAATTASAIEPSTARPLLEATVAADNGPAVSPQHEVVIAEVLEPPPIASPLGDRSAPSASVDGTAATELSHAELELQTNWERLQKRWRHFVETPLSPVPAELQPVSAQADSSDAAAASAAAAAKPPPLSQLTNRVLQAALIGTFVAQWAPVASAVTSGSMSLDRNTLLGLLLACPGTPLTEAWQLVSPANSAALCCLATGPASQPGPPVHAAHLPCRPATPSCRWA